MEYIPQLYVKLKGCNPPPASSHTEDRLEGFEKCITEAVKNNKNIKQPFSSLTPQQRETLNILKNNKDHIILPTDKNLGPAIVNYDDYVRQVLHKHLLTSSYKRLPKNTAQHKLSQTTNQLIDAFNTH
jgi:hypothetical protein